MLPAEAYCIHLIFDWYFSESTAFPQGNKKTALVYFVYLSIIVVVSRKEIHKPHEYIMEAFRVFEL
jgi:hypothetical protein